MKSANATWTVKQSPESIMKWMHEQLATVPKVESVNKLSDDAIEVRTVAAHGGSVALAILLFPIGLLFLFLWKDRGAMLIKATARDGYTELAFRGETSVDVIRSMTRIFGSLQAADSLVYLPVAAAS